MAHGDLPKNRAASTTAHCKLEKKDPSLPLKETNSNEITQVRVSVCDNEGRFSVPSPFNFREP